MKNKSFQKDLYPVLAIAISGALCIVLVLLLYKNSKNTVGFAEILNKLTHTFIGISGFLSAILMVFLATSATNLKANKVKIIARIGKTTPTMHHFRNIAEILFHSNIWLPGLREYIEKEYAELTYFDV